MSYTPLQLAEAYTHTGELTDALDVLNSHLNDHPTDEAALRLRGHIRLRLGDNPGAVADFALIQPPMPEDAIALSVALDNMGQAQPARDTLARAHATHPLHDALTMRYVELLIRTEQVSVARQVIHHQLGHTPDSPYWRARMGDVLVLCGEPEAAIPQYTHIIDALLPKARVSPNTHTSAMVGGWLCARAGAWAAYGKIDSALSDYTQAQDLLPHDALIPLNIGLLLLGSDYTAAQTHIQQAWHRAKTAATREAISAAVPPDLHTLLE